MADNRKTTERNGAVMTKITNSLALAGVAGALAFAALTAGTTTTATAGSYRDGGLTAIWVYIRAFPDEDIWESCRRVYGRDVYKVRRGGGPREARCYVDTSNVGDPRGYNRSRYRN